MYVCKNFYQQFEWAQEADWEALSFYPVLICQGEDDKVTPLEGAKILFRFLSSKRIERNTVIVSKSEAEDEAEAVATTDLSVKVKVEINETEAQDRIRLKIITQTSHQLLEEKPVEIVAHMDNFFRSLCDLSFIPESRLEV
jgi:pimeloyl-ACP methyl ester carboxylesterase